MFPDYDPEILLLNFDFRYIALGYQFEYLSQMIEIHLFSSRPLGMF